MNDENKLRHPTHANLGMHVGAARQKLVENVDRERGENRIGITLPAFLALLNPKSHNLKAMLHSLKRSAALTKDIFELLSTATEEQIREQKRT